MKQILIIFLLTATLASARIGETFEQCVARYGKVVKESKDSENRPTSIFIKGGFRITIRFVDNKACVLTFTKEAGPFSDVELNTLVSANGTDWVASKPFIWHAPNPKRTAISDKERKILMIFDDVVTQKEDDKKKIDDTNAESKRLEGF